MIGAINSNVMTVAASSQYGQVNRTGKADEAAPAEERKRGTHGVPSVDTVEISQEGRAYVEASEASGASQGMTDVTPQVTSDSVVSAASGTATDTAVSAKQSVKTDTADTYAVSEEAEEDDLSEYTDSELELMMYKGDITRQEYKDEMVSRNGVAAAVEE